MRAEGAQIFNVGIYVFTEIPTDTSLWSFENDEAFWIARICTFPVLKSRIFIDLKVKKKFRAEGARNFYLSTWKVYLWKAERDAIALAQWAMVGNYVACALHERWDGTGMYVHVHTYMPRWT